MAQTLHSLVPDADIVLSLEPEQLGAVLLVHLNSLPDNEQAQLNRYNFFAKSYGSNSFAGYPPQYFDQVSDAFLEGWAWLEREGLLISRVDTSGNAFRVSRRGRQLKTTAAVKA